MLDQNLFMVILKGLDAQSFLLAFRRFIARRGRPDLIISDNQSTLKAAEKIVTPCWYLKGNELQDFLAEEKIRWHFITEKAPWSGGIYERLIGIMKKSLDRAMGKRILTADEFLTVITEVETIVNCRPITPIDSEFNFDKPQQIALRPIDFISPHGNANVGVPSFDYDEDDPEYIPQQSTSNMLNKLMSKTANILENFWKCIVKKDLQVLIQKLGTLL
jgi:hypothetical protein